MADKELGDLTNASALDGTELIHVKQGANSRDALISAIGTYLQGLQEETHVTLAGDQSITDANLNKVDWDTETRDDGGWHESVTNKDRMTTGDGVFDATVKIKLITIAATPETYGVELGRYNSSAVLQEIVGEDQRTLDSTLDPVITFSVLNIRMSSGDFLRVSVQSSDTDYSVESDDSFFMVRTAGITSGISIFSGCRAKRITSTFSIPNNTETRVEFNGEDWDTDDYHDNSTNPDRFTVPAGRPLEFYRLTAGWETETYAAAHLWQNSIGVNGSVYPTFCSETMFTGSANNSKASVMTTVVQMQGGDYAHLNLFHTRGSAVLIDANDSTFFVIERI